MKKAAWHAGITRAQALHSVVHAATPRADPDRERKSFCNTAANDQVRCAFRENGATSSRTCHAVRRAATKTSSPRALDFRGRQPSDWSGELLLFIDETEPLGNGGGHENSPPSRMGSKRSCSVGDFCPAGQGSAGSGTRSIAKLSDVADGGSARNDF